MNSAFKQIEEIRLKYGAHGRSRLNKQYIRIQVVLIWKCMSNVCNNDHLSRETETTVEHLSPAPTLHDLISAEFMKIYNDPDSRQLLIDDFMKVRGGQCKECGELSLAVCNVRLYI